MTAIPATATTRSRPRALEPHQGDSDDTLEHEREGEA